jgi:hypothetical protein
MGSNFLPLSPCGRGWPREARTGEGYLSARKNPSLRPRYLLPQGEKEDSRPDSYFKELNRIRAASWSETRGYAALLTMRAGVDRVGRPHPEERRLRRVSKDGPRQDTSPHSRSASRTLARSRYRRRFETVGGCHQVHSLQNPSRFRFLQPR